MGDVAYLLNSNIHGYEQVGIEDFKFEDKRDNTIVTVIDKTCDDKLAMYYNMFANTLKHNNKIVLIGINDENKSFRVLASLMVTFSDYNIYQVEDKTMLGAKELQTMCEREPGIEEVQTYIGGDVTAYSDLSTIVFGIESMVSEGNEEQLKDFLEQHLISIESLVFTLNYMKHICDLSNNEELVTKINTLKTKISGLESQLEESKKSFQDMKYEKEKIQVEAESLKRKVSKLEADNTELKANNEDGVTLVKQYNTINTALIKCKTKIILYFKEISYVPYTNSMVHQLNELLKNKRLKGKVVIYDTNNELSSMYKPLNVLNGESYTTMKDTTISKTQKFVMGEPLTNCLQDILTSEQCFDYVIVYDRMRGLKDLVTGNNVTRLFVINSSKQFENVKSQLGIKDISHVITNVQSGIAKNGCLNIPFIEGYSIATDSAKTARYMKLAIAGTKDLLLQKIIKLSNLDTLIN